MTAAPERRQDWLVALGIALAVHVLLAIGAVVLLALEIAKGEELPEEVGVPPEEQIVINVVAEEPAPPPPPAAEEEVAQEPEAEKEEPAAPKEESVPVPPPPPIEGFVQTVAEQEAEEKPENASLIGERDTKASSNAGAIAGEEQVAALAGERERRQDVKTFDSDFQQGENQGDSAEISRELLEPQAAAEEVGEEPEKMVETEAEVEEVAEPTEAPEEQPDEDLAALENALKSLEEVIEKAETAPPKEVAKPTPKKPEVVDGSFRSKTRKTRIRGVLSANGPGSLDVENTPIGRYQAKVLRRLEETWQMENIRNRSLIAPGNITLYFAIDDAGTVQNQRRVAMNGASTTQWGMVLRALSVTRIPRMPSDVRKELEGDALELTVTFNY